jgi:putative transposase
MKESHIKTVSAKLYPSRDQEQTLFRFLNVTRWIYNRALEHRIKAWKRRKKSVAYNEQQALLTQWRRRVEWIRAVPVEVERDALRRVDRGMGTFFRHLRAGQSPGFPRFKNRNRWRSFEALQTGTYLRESNHVYIPGVGPMKYRGLKPFEGAVKGIRVLKKARGWYVQLIVDNGPAPEKRSVETSVGIDVGLTHFATLSDGRQIENPRWYQNAEHRLRFLQKIVSRRKKGSRRRRKAVNRLARFHERIADTRKDWLHKETRKLVDEFDLIAVEDLNVEGMSRSRFGKSILDAAWSEFVNQLSYKAENAGGSLVRVNPRGTSQECSGCGATVPKLLHDRVHRCVCGLTLDRDHNAALNIVGRATAKLTPVESTLAGDGAQSPSRRGSLKREVLPALS